VARELVVTAADLSDWREAFLEAGAASLESRARDDRDETIARLRIKVGELTVDTELLHAKIERLEAGAHPMAAGCHGGPGWWRRPFCGVEVGTPLRSRLRGDPGGDERRHLDLHAPPLRCRPDLLRLGVARAGVYRRRCAAQAAPAPRRRLGPQGPMADAALVEAILQVLTDSPLHSEGYRKAWARLRHAGLRTWTERVRRLMRENGLSATTRMGSPRGPRNHDGTIIPETVDTMRGTDMTATVTVDTGGARPRRSVTACLMAPWKALA
jgi:hypothetical protein